MKLSTLADGTPDGRLVLVSRDLKRAIAVADIAATLQQAIDRWTEVEPGLRTRAAELESGNAPGGFDYDEADALAPLPRAWQWLDGSVFETHGALLQKMMGLEPNPAGRPLMYQGISNRFLSPTQDVPLPSEDDGIDFEGEFGVIVDEVPLGVTAEQAAGHIKLIVQVNDWSLRGLAKVEMQTGFGWIQAKPPCSVAPVAVTPDELGAHWKEERVDLPLTIHWNGRAFGRASGYEMAYSFAELVAHAARTRSLCAGTIIGSGTVSNAAYAEVGSSCIAEVRAIEMIARGEPKTAFMRFGDTVRMEVTLPDGTPVFGILDQRVVKA